MINQNKIMNKNNNSKSKIIKALIYNISKMVTIFKKISYIKINKNNHIFLQTKLKNHLNFCNFKI